MQRTVIASLVLALFLGGLACAADKSAATPLPPEPDGMVKLFNGKDLTGWDGDPRLWSVKDGALRGETTEQIKANGNTFIIWKDGTVKDFELRFSYRCSASNNSGVQYRSKHITDARNNKWVVRGYQGEIRNEVKLPNVSGFIYDEGGKRGRLLLVGEKAVWEDGKKTSLGTVCTAEEYAKAFKLDGWNEYVIIAKGNNIKQYVNGVQTVDFTDNQPELALKEGIIALQLHAGKPMWVDFKDIRLKQYDAK